MSAATRGRLGWAGWALISLLAAGGAASSPGGWRLGIAPAATVVVIVLGAVLLAWRAPTRGGVGLGLLPIAGLVLFGAPLPGVAAVTGQPLFALVLAAAALFLAQGRREWVGRAFLPVVGLVYLLAAGRVQQQVGPEGDEPHYLMVADSLIHDRDLELERDYQEGRYRAFHPRPLAPHYRLRGRHGEIYSLHALGLSLLVLPAYALGGYKAASFFMAGLGVLLALEMRRLLRETFADDHAADGTAWVLALSPPLLSYSGLVFTEVPAALAVAVALRRGRRPGALSLGASAGLGAVLSFLPWLNVRYAALSALLALFVLAARPGLRRSAAFLAPAVLSATGLALYHFVLYGFLDPRRVYGRRPEFAWVTLREGLPGLLLDQEFGLLVYAPAFALALAGVRPLWRRDRRLALLALALVTAVMGTAGAWHMWRGGFNPPARFLVPVLPVLALAVAAALSRGFSAPAALLVGWGLWLGAAGVAEPRLVHRDRDGTAPLLRAASGAEEWTRLLPGFVLQDPARNRLAAVWGLALLAALPFRGGATARGLAGAALGLMAAAGAASLQSTAKTGGRDAVRVLGRPALAVPGLVPVREASARWSAKDLSWGPLYEPHRFPAGAAIGERLRLPAGRFRLGLRAQVLDERAEPPRLRLQGPFCGPTPVYAFERTSPGFAATFALPQADPDLTVLVEGGGAFLLEELELRVGRPGEP